MKSDKFFRENTTLSKIALYALGGAAAIWAVKKLKESAVKKEKQDNLDSLVTKAVTETGLSATITSNQAKVIADQLYNAMEGTGTDENAIINALNSLNAVDLAMVNAAFGYRNYGTFGSPMFGEGTPLSLMSWFQKELSGSTLKYIQDRYRDAGISGIGAFPNLSTKQKGIYKRQKGNIMIWEYADHLTLEQIIRKIMMREKCTYNDAKSVVLKFNYSNY